MFTADDIIEMDSNSLIKFIICHNPEHSFEDDDIDVEMLQSIALSISLSPIDINKFKINEILNALNLFSSDDSLNEILPLLFESTNYVLNNELLEQIKEFCSCPIVEIKSLCSLDCIHVNTLLVSVESDCISESKHVRKYKVYNYIQSHNSTSIIATRLLSFGILSYSINYDKTVESGALLCSSSTYDYVRDIDDFFDLFYWGYGYNIVIPIPFDENSIQSPLVINVKDNAQSCKSELQSEFENSLLELLIYTNEDLASLVKSWTPMLSMIGGAAHETNKMVETLLTDIAIALNNHLNQHSYYAIGRLHQTLTQLVESSSGVSLMKLPPQFVQAINNFIRLKINLSNVNVIRYALSKVSKSVQVYLSDLKSNYNNETNLLQNNSEYSRLSNFISRFPPLPNVLRVNDTTTKIGYESATIMPSNSAEISIDTTNQFTFEELVCIQENLRPKPFEIMGSTDASEKIQSKKSRCKNELYNNFRFKQLYELKPASYMPSIPLDIFGTCRSTSDTQLLDELATYYCETLSMDILQIGSILGYQLPIYSNNGSNSSLVNQEIIHSAQLIHQLLNSGFAYVCSSSGKLMAMLSMERSVLLLNNITNNTSTTTKNIYSDTLVPKQVIKRLKDMPRLFRNQKAHNLPKLSLRVNTNFDLAITLLRAHHGDDCWVGKELECVWKYMYDCEPPQLVIFELWLSSNSIDGEVVAEEMVAADFGHFTAHNKSIYIATRFFNRSHSNPKIKQLQPGFILGLCECQILRKFGCLQWDLGGIDLCPLMRYKLDLTGDPISRPKALDQFRKIRDCSNSQHEKKSDQYIPIIRNNSILINNITYEHVCIN